MRVGTYEGIVLCYLLCVAKAAENVRDDGSRSVSSEFYMREFGRALLGCFAGDEKIQCLQAQVLQGLDAAIHDNSSWQYSDYLVIEKNHTRRRALQHRQGRARAFSDTVAEKLLQLTEGRTVRLQMPPQSLLPVLTASISGAVDDLRLTKPSAITIPINSGGFADGVAVDTEEGRKKKDKDKHGGMAMGGMAMMAMVAQMFFGKVILIAGAAFVMAKIALIVSLLGSLKKGSTGSSGSTDHVIVTNAGGGGGHDSPGWHRSMPPYELPKLHAPLSHEHFEAPSTEYESIGPPHSAHHTSDAEQPHTHSQPPSSYYNYELIEEQQGDEHFKRRQTPGGFL